MHAHRLRRRILEEQLPGAESVITSDACISHRLPNSHHKSALGERKRREQKQCQFFDTVVSVPHMFLQITTKINKKEAVM